MVYNACSNGYAICKDLYSSPTYDQRSFFPVLMFFHTQLDFNTNISNKLALNLSETHESTRKINTAAFNNLTLSFATY